MSAKESSAELVEDFDDGQPVRKHHENPFFTVAIFFMICDLFERFGYYSMFGSQIVTFFTRELGLSSLLATQLQSTFQSILYFVPLIGAYMADSFLGRYKTLLISFIIYIAGGAVVTLGAWLENAIIFFIAFFGLVTLGSGGVKPNLIVLGGDQFDEEIPKQNAQKSSYFAGFYWCTNVAATVAFMLMAGIALNGMGAIPQEMGFIFTFAVGTISLVLATASFLVGTPRYYLARPQGSALPLFFRITGSGCATFAGKAIVAASFFMILGVIITIVGFFVPSPYITYIAGGFIGAGYFLLIIFGRSAEWVTRGCEGKGHDPQAIDDAKQVYRMMPYVAFVVPFWAVYNQMNTNFPIQGCQMYEEVFGIIIASPQMSTWNTIGVLAGVPIADRIIYPLMSKCGIRPTPLKRVGIGFATCVAAMVCAGFLEIARKASGESDRVSSCGTVMQSNLNLQWQAILYILVGLAEVFTAITYYDLFYSEVPMSMRSVCQAINMLTTSIGTMFGGTLNSLTAVFITNDLNDGHIEYTFFILAAIGAANTILYAFVARGFVYAHPVDAPEDTASVLDENEYAKASRRGSTISAR